MITRFSRWVVSAALAFLMVGGHPSAQGPMGPIDILSSERADLVRARTMLAGGDAIGSRPIFESIAAAATAAGDQLLLQRALYGLSDVQSELNDFPAMIDMAQRAYDALPDPNGRPRVVLLTYRGRAFTELRDREAAVAAYTEALELARAIPGADSNVGGLINDMGLLTWRLDRDHDRALAYYEQSLAIFRRLKELRNQRVVLNNSGNLFRRPGVYDEAERRYREGLKLAAAEGAQDAMLLKNLGVVLRETGRREEAEPILQQAVSLADSGGIGRIRWMGRMELGNFYREQDVERAAANFEGALSVLEAQFSSVLLEGFRAGALSGALTINDDPYELYIDLLLNNNRQSDAFFVSERARARAFLDTLSLAREQLAASLPPAYVAEERAILARISTDQATLRTASLPAERRAALEVAVGAEEERLTALRLRLAADYPALAHARYPQLFTLADVQQRLLGPMTRCCSIFLARNRESYGSSRRTAWRCGDSPRAPRLKARSATCERRWPRQQGSTLDASAKVASLVLPDFKELVGNSRRLLIIPHGVLNYVPFETLPTSDDRFLVEQHLVSYAPSASSLAFLRGRPASGTELLAFGNPVMAANGADAERGRAVVRTDLLKPLPHSGTEVRAVSAVFGSTAQVFEQQAASEVALAGARLSNAGILHFATHGLVDEERPDRSGLALSAVPPQSDGILQLREVFRLNLSAALVTLSACETALGKDVIGEGLIGLSRAFFYAGANAVLASMWSVNDASTVQLMTPLYESLAAGKPLDEAVQSAKLTLIRSGGRLSHPYYWAPFVVSGHATAQVPVRPGWRVTRVLWGSGALLLLVGAALVFRRRVR